MEPINYGTSTSETSQPTPNPEPITSSNVDVKIVWCPEHNIKAYVFATPYQTLQQFIATNECPECHKKYEILNDGNQGHYKVVG